MMQTFNLELFLKEQYVPDPKFWYYNIAFNLTASRNNNFFIVFLFCFFSTKIKLAKKMIQTSKKDVGLLISFPDYFDKGRLKKSFYNCSFYNATIVGLHTKVSRQLSTIEL